MKKRNIFAGLSAMFLMAAATGCSNDLPDVVGPDNGGSENDGPGVYMGVNFMMPSQGGTRSWTDGDDSSSDDVEVGTEIENNVNEVLLVLAKTNDNGFIAASTVSRENLTVSTGATNKTYQAKAKFELNNLEMFYQDPNVEMNAAGNCEVNVFVFCNATKGIVDAVSAATYGSTTWIDTPADVTVTGQVTEGSIWSSTNGGSFLMSNAKIATREIPGAINIWDNYTTQDKCFHLSHKNTGTSTIDNETGKGAVKVERAAARIDFRDASPKDQTYDVFYVKNASGENENLIISVKLYKMALVNMCNKFYYLSRVSNTGLPGGAGFEICGPEKPWFADANGTFLPNSGNFIVGPYADMFVNAAGITSGFGTYFNYPFFNEDGSIDNTNASNADRWGTVVIEDLLKSDNPDDNWVNENKKGTYKVWRYMTENVIPGVEQQVNAISTGVVFKGKMLGNTDAPAQGTTLDENEKQVISILNNKEAEFGDAEKAPILYKLDGRVYADFQNVYDAAIAASFSYKFDDNNNIIPTWNRSNSLYKAVFGNGGTGYSVSRVVPGKGEDAGKDVTKTYTDELAIDTESVYAKYLAWKPANADIVAANKPAFQAAATEAGFTLYQRSYDATEGWGYYCYYYHWIRHNDNGKNGIMGPMEFDVVRNNVYKLAVTTINDLGHPRISANDPDKPKPDTPDESTKIYMTVDSEVLPWVVRVNDIVFD